MLVLFIVDNWRLRFNVHTGLPENRSAGSNFEMGARTHTPHTCTHAHTHAHARTHTHTHSADHRRLSHPWRL